MIRAVNGALMVRFLPLWNYINDESHDCVAFYRPDAIGGPRSTEHVRQRDTMNLSRVWVTLRASDYLLRLFPLIPRGSLRSLFSHLGYPPRAARAINFSNTATVFTAGSRGKYAKLKLSRETARLERVRLEAPPRAVRGNPLLRDYFLSAVQFLACCLY